MECAVGTAVGPESWLSDVIWLLFPSHLCPTSTSPAQSLSQLGSGVTWRASLPHLHYVRRMPSFLSQEELIQLASNCEYKRYVFYGRFRQSFFAHLRDGGRSHDAFWWILDNQRLHVSPLSREVVRHEPRAYRSVDDLVVYLHFYFICRTW